MLQGKYCTDRVCQVSIGVASHPGNAGSSPAGITTNVHKGLREIVSPFLFLGFAQFLMGIGFTSPA